MSITEPSSPAPVRRKTAGEDRWQDDRPQMAPVVTQDTLRLWQAFAPLAPEHRRWALTGGVVESARAGESFGGAADVVVVVSGCLATLSPGSALASELLGPGDVVATGGDRAVAAQWVTDGELYRIARSDWLSRAGVEGLTHLLNGSDVRRGVLERRLACAVSHLATARVADLILAVHEAAPGADIPLSQERLGGMLGLRRTTVNSSCRTLESTGGSRTRRGKIRMMDAEILGRFACGCRRPGLTPAVGPPG